MSKKIQQMPKFKNESQEADWWASRAGREFIRHKTAGAKSKGTEAEGSPLVAKLNQNAKSAERSLK